MNKIRILLIVCFMLFPFLSFSQDFVESKISGSEINEIYTSVYNAKNKKEKTALTELLAEKFIEKEQYSEAEDIYKDLLGANPSKKKRFEYYLKIGDIAVLEKNYALALDYYGKAKSLYKKNVMVNSKMGDVFLMSNLYNLAERSFLEVLSVDKNYRYAKKRLGDTYFQRGLYSKALSYYEQINNAEDDKELIINMVASYRNISETDKALALVREYLSKNNAAEIFFLSGLLHSDKKNYDLAEEDFLMSIKLDENNFTPSIYLASIYYDAGKYKQAKFYADKAYLLNSSYAATDLLNAKISYKMKRIYDARRYAHNAFIKAKTPFMKERAQQLIAYLQEIK